MGSAENGGGQHLAPEGRQIGTPPPWDVYDTFPNLSKNCAEPLHICVLPDSELPVVHGAVL